MLLVEELAPVDNLRLPTCRSPSTTTKIENLQPGETTGDVVANTPSKTARRNLCGT